MKRALCFILAAATMGPAFASGIGDTFDQVIAEKGKPERRVEAGALQILCYPDATIKLRDNVVVSIKAPEPRAAGVAPAAAPVAAADIPRPAPGPASQEAAVPQTDDLSNSAAWTTDYNSALDRAKNEHRRVFLFFTGSDWCPWCKKLYYEILRTDQFTQLAQGKLVLVEVDFPRHRPQTEELKDQNRLLSAQYHVTGYPTVVVLDSTGKSVARLGYQEGGPGPFINRLQTAGQ